MRLTKRAALSATYWLLGVGVGYFAARATQRFDLAEHATCPPGERLEVTTDPGSREVVLSCVQVGAGAGKGSRR